MSNAPVIKEVIKPVKEVVAGKPPAQVTATARKQAARAREKRGRAGMGSLLSRARGGMGGNQLARTLGGLD